MERTASRSSVFLLRMESAPKELGHVVHVGMQAAVDGALGAGDVARADSVVRDTAGVAHASLLADLSETDGGVVIGAAAGWPRGRPSVSAVRWASWPTDAFWRRSSRACGLTCLRPPHNWVKDP
jgi:hypothetical protein